MQESDSKFEPPAIDAEKPQTNASADPSVGGDFLPFPSSAELNGRFRRLITLYQRTSKVTLAKEELKAKVSRLKLENQFFFKVSSFEESGETRTNASHHART